MFLSNKETALEVLKLGEAKMQYSNLKTIILGFLGGAYIGLAALGYLIAYYRIGGGLGAFIGACIFPTGLMLCVLVGGSLFTGDCLAFLALMKRKFTTSLFITKLIFVWIGNVFGAFFIALVSFFGGSYKDLGFSEFIVNICDSKLHLGFFEAICSGFLCNALVAIGVWFALASKSLEGKILAIFFPVMLFIVGGFQHIVANMYYLSVGILLDISIFSFSTLSLHLLAVSIGNFLSGAIFLPIMYYFGLLK
ncbi:formate/nitrite transporter family protein [Helicobacter sp. 16-1353]|uniref:formate/nitrite transporter family protein n=1 Tax=Helicobacter sp. 16-1353 TaxID=2004996 RepID=UPI0015EF6059|nr:formate/nitrite transporter family protein [Helicobacter sp. 16-1353]